MKIVAPSVCLVDHTVNALQVITNAGRTCYQSAKQGDYDSFVRMIINRGHESVLEHAYASFRIVCDRGVSHELVRHRVPFSYSQESTRFCNYGGNDIGFVQPPGLQDPAAYLAWKEVCENCEACYKTMLVHGCSPQIARSVLPTCLKTELVMTANLRGWRNFLKLRCDKAAHPQMRFIAGQIGACLAIYVPPCFEDIRNLIETAVAETTNQ